MTPPHRGTLIAVASCMFYQPKGNEKECAELAALGYIRPIDQGKIHGYCVALPGTIYLRKEGKYE